MWTVPGLIRQALLLGYDDRFQLDAVLWSLVHEWRIALLLPLVLLLRGRAAVLSGLALAAWTLAVALGAPDNGAMLGKSFAATFPATLYFIPAFAGGASLALMPPRQLTETEAVAGGASVLALMAASQDFAIIAASMILILLALRDGPFAARLRHPALVWLGQVSFSLYLIHMPLLLAASHLLHGWVHPAWIGMIVVLASFPAAAALFVLVEKPSHVLARRIRIGDGLDAPRFAPSFSSPPRSQSPSGQELSRGNRL
jgi:peptidoglycan/LPS O-acetylase OafA/YrhL